MTRQKNLRTSNHKEDFLFVYLFCHLLRCFDKFRREVRRFLFLFSFFCYLLASYHFSSMCCGVFSVYCFLYVGVTKKVAMMVIKKM